MTKKITRVLAAVVLALTFLATAAAPAAAESGITWEYADGFGGDDATNITWE